jgi:uncharacterized lipoprotein (TIGR02269 family)
MTKPLRSPLPFWLCLAALLLSGCASPSPATRAGVEGRGEDGGECEAPDEDQCVVLACDGEEGLCGVFACEDVDPEALALASPASGVELARFRPPPRYPGPFRNWRNTGLRAGAQPRMAFHFRYREGFLPAFPRLEGKLIKHHLFPQAAELAAWFRKNGINPHDWTMVIPEQVHLRIHRGGNRGGLWNQAWREYQKANLTREVSPEELLAKAFELAYRFDIVGPIIPYGHTLVPPGPQLFAP